MLLYIVYHNHIKYLRVTAKLEYVIQTNCPENIINCFTPRIKAVLQAVKFQLNDFIRKLKLKTNETLLTV